MSLIVHLPPELEKKLQQRVAAAGIDAESFVLQAVEEKLQGPQSLEEILAPFRRQVVESGMNDGQLNSFYEELRDEVWPRQREDKP